MANTKAIGVAYSDQALVNGSVDNSPIGATTPNTGAFTTLSANSFTASGTTPNYFAGNVVIETNTSLAALRVTQTGSGNSILVEDSGNPDATPFVVDNAGNVGIGGTTSTSVKVSVLGLLPQSGGTGLGFANYGTIASGTTGVYQSFRSALSTEAAAFTLPLLYNYFAGGTAIGGGSAVTTQAGFFVDGGLTTATNNYGFYGNIASGTNRFNFYAAGTADNYMAGSLGVGAIANASALLDVQSTTKGVRMPNMTTTQKNAIASPAAGLMVFDTTLAKLCVYSGAAWQTITSV